MLHPVKRHSNRSRDAIHPLVVTTCSRLVFGQQPKFVLHSTDRHSGGPVGFFPVIVAVIRSRIVLGNNRHTIGILKSVFGIQSGANQALFDLVIFGKTSRFCPSNYQSHSKQAQNRLVLIMCTSVSRASAQKPSDSPECWSMDTTRS